MFPAFLQCRTQRPPLLAWMLLTTRGKKFKPYKPEKTAEQVGRMLHPWSEWQADERDLARLGAPLGLGEVHYLQPPSCMQKAEAKRAVRSRRRETARWLSSVTKGDYNLCFAAAVDKQVLA